MSSIGNISAANNLSYLQPTSNATQRVAGGDSDGDSDSSGSGGVGKSNFMSAIAQALGQNLPGGSATSSASNVTAPSAGSTQDPQAALQAFVQNLFSSLGQTNGTSQANGTGQTKRGDSDDSGGKSVAGSQGSNMLANLQNLLQQLSAPAGSTSQTSSATDPLAGLSSSFQNLLSSMNASQGQTAPNTAQGQTTPTLQSFLQNLMQNMGNGQNISGAMVSTTA